LDTEYTEHTDKNQKIKVRMEFLVSESRLRRLLRVFRVRNRFQMDSESMLVSKEMPDEPKRIGCDCVWVGNDRRSFGCHARRIDRDHARGSRLMLESNRTPILPQGKRVPLPDESSESDNFRRPDLTPTTSDPFLEDSVPARRPPKQEEVPRRSVQPKS
jgi:hypothetical protein